MAEAANAELETFRKQWQEEVSARAKASSSSNKPVTLSGLSDQGSDQKNSYPLRARSIQRDRRKTDDRIDGPDAAPYYDFQGKDIRQRLGESIEESHPERETNEEPSSALEHYEQAVQRESQGNLGDSLRHYRKAYRLDAGVDRLYKNKHFPPPASNSRPEDPNPSNASVTVPNTAHHSLDGPSSTITELIALFSSLSIPPAPPPTDESPQPPCPISSLPSELLIYILQFCALADIASFARLALVCKRLAYLIATEDQLWKSICLDPNQGFAAMHYSWNCTVSGKPLLPDENISHDLGSTLDLEDTPNATKPPSIDPTKITPLLPPSPPSFLLNPTYPTYRTMFRTRPRIRFGGCYISTVNYTRPGASSPSQISWNVPVHIVTYYRYLRFFRDGSCLSLLTTTEPADVVHHIRPKNMDPQLSGSTLPVGVIKHALRGRWKLTGPTTDLPTTTDGASAIIELEGSIHIETEGIDPDKYIFKLHLGFRSAGRATGVPRNNKLVWKGFWSYNRLTDDWAEFGLRNDRSFFWSRVGSYGMGE